MNRSGNPPGGGGTFHTIRHTTLRGDYAPVAMSSGFAADAIVGEDEDYIAETAETSGLTVSLLHGLVGGDFSVANENDAVCVLRDIVFVSHQNDGVPLAIQILE